MTLARSLSNLKIRGTSTGVGTDLSKTLSSPWPSIGRDAEECEKRMKRGNASWMCRQSYQPVEKRTGKDVWPPGSADPGSADPGSTDPGSTDPGSADPGSADPLVKVGWTFLSGQDHWPRSCFLTGRYPLSKMRHIIGSALRGVRVEWIDILQKP